MSARILLRAPEITLKGRNQPAFLKRLRANVDGHLRAAGLGAATGSARGRLYVELDQPGEEALARAVEVLVRVPGVELVNPGLFLPAATTGQERGKLRHPPLRDAVVGLCAERPARGRSFALRVNRLHKELDEDSEEIARWLGDAIRERTDWERVDLDAPDVELFVDIYPDGIFVSAEKLRGVGGLPVGSAGRVLTLLSGGIDSPVAAFLMAKRGCSVDFLHVSASHPERFDAERSVVGRLARELSRSTRASRLHVVPYGPFEVALPAAADGAPGAELVVFRRFLARLGERLARELGAAALVTGDSLAQVASQTLSNLAATSRAVEIPILRPLVGLNKGEIIALSRGLGTYETSIEPSPDCCALLTRDPRTSTRHDRLTELEGRLFPDYPGLVAETLDAARAFRYVCGERRD